MRNLDVSSIITAIITGIGETFAFLESTTVTIAPGVSFTLLSLFIAALVLAVLINILLPDLKSGDIGIDDYNDYKED